MENNGSAYKSYIEYNESLKLVRENISLNEKSDIVRILKPKNDNESKSLTEKLLIDITFPREYIYSIAGKDQIKNTKEYDQLFTLSIKVCDSDKKELNPESKIIINKEKDIDEYDTSVVRLESTNYKNISTNNDELYKFGQGIEFKRDEHLRLYVVDTDIDISPENVEFNINIDKWNH